MARVLTRFTIAWVLGVFALSACSGGEKSASQEDLAATDVLDGRLPTDVGIDTTDAQQLSDMTPDPDLVELVADVAVPDLAPAPCEGTPTQRPLSGTPDETFDLGPYLMMLKPDGVTIMWRTLEDSDGLVWLGESAPDGSYPDDKVTRIHEVEITGLKPDTEYQYKVVSDGTESAVHTFRTAVPANQPFRFVLWGDNQNGPEVFQDLVGLMIASGPHIALGVGDHVQTGKEESLWKEQLFQPARALLHQVPFYAAMGNHEGNSQFYRDLYSYPHPVDDPNHESYYWYTYGNAFFLVLDTNTLLCPLGDVEVPQSEFIKEALATPEAQNATWRFAYAHESAYSESWSPGDCDYDGMLCLRSWLLPLLAEHNFHAWFSGHTHDYERGRVQDVLHFIAGGGGGSLDEWCKDWETTSVVYQGHHFLRADAGCDTLRIETVAADGNVIDWVVTSPDRQVIEEGPVPGLPESIISSDSPTREE